MERGVLLAVRCRARPCLTEWGQGCCRLGTGGSCEVQQCRQRRSEPDAVAVMSLVMVVGDGWSDWAAWPVCLQSVEPSAVFPRTQSSWCGAVASSTDRLVSLAFILNHVWAGGRCRSAAHLPSFLSFPFLPQRPPLTRLLLGGGCDVAKLMLCPRCSCPRSLIGPD